MERRHDHKKGSGLTRIHRVKARVVERGRRERRGGEARMRREEKKRPREEGSRAEKERIVLRFRNQFLWFNFYGWTSSLIYGAVQPRPSCPPTPPLPPLERLSTFYWVDQFLCVYGIYTHGVPPWKKISRTTRDINASPNVSKNPNGIHEPLLASVSIPSLSPSLPHD